MSEIPSAKLIALVKGRRAFHVNECPVCKEQIAEKTKKVKGKEAISLASGKIVFSESVVIDSDNYSTHYRQKHG